MLHTKQKALEGMQSKSSYSLKIPRHYTSRARPLMLLVNKKKGINFKQRDIFKGMIMEITKNIKERSRYSMQVPFILSPDGYMHKMKYNQFGTSKLEPDIPIRIFCAGGEGT